MSINLTEFKFSKFNHKIYLEEELYLYNSFTGGFGKVGKDNKHHFYKSDLESHDDVPIELVSDIDFINSLLDGGIIVHKDINENEMLESIHNINRFGNSNSLGITIIPTTNCNFRCTYCFEQNTNYPNKVMDSNTIEEMLKFINRSLNDNGKLNIAWFGGEPLLELKIIRKIQSELQKMSKERGISVVSGIVTNGYLLTKEVSNELVDLGVTSAQITLDGSPEIHNKRRKLKNGMGTYDRIIENILQSNNNLRISIRINIDKNNIDDVDKFLDSLLENGICKKENVSIYFAIVRDYDTTKKHLSHECYNIKEFSGEELNLRNLAQNKGIQTGPISIDPNIVGCGAVSPRSFVIEPDGTLQKCWNSVGNKEHAIGNIFPERIENNKYIYLSNQYKWYSWHGYNKSKCKDCNVLPLCMGGCPYYDLYPSNLFENNNYGCTPLKYNINETLKQLV